MTTNNNNQAANNNNQAANNNVLSNKVLAALRKKANEYRDSFKTPVKSSWSWQPLTKMQRKCALI